MKKKTAWLLLNQITTVLASGGAVAAFSPDDLSDLLLWLKADSGVYEDSAKTTPAADDGDVVGAWEDNSVNSNDVTQATTVFKPTLKLNILNGLPAIRFVGNDFLSRADALGLTGNPSLTCYIVASIVDDTSPERLFQIGDNEGAGGQVICLSPEGATSPTETSSFRFNNGNQIFNNTSTAAPAKILTFQRTTGDGYGDGKFWIGDSEETETSSASPGSTPNIPDEETMVGNGRTGVTPTYALNGDIYEMMFYNDVHTPDEMADVWEYLSDRWGITL